MLTIENIFVNYPDIVTVKQMKDMLAIGDNKAYELIKNNSIQTIDIGRKHLIPKINIIEFLNRTQISA